MSIISAFFKKPSCHDKVQKAEVEMGAAVLRLTQSIQAMVDVKQPRPAVVRVHTIKKG